MKAEIQFNGFIAIIPESDSEIQTLKDMAHDNQQNVLIETEHQVFYDKCIIYLIKQ